MKIRYTVTTYTKSCPKCGHVLEEETKGELTPILSVLGLLLFPITLSYIFLYFLAFSSPTLRDIGPKYRYCPSCLEIMRTENCYIEELCGKDLLDHKFYALFFLAYALGGAILYALLYGILDGFSEMAIAVAIICSCFLVGIVITYRILLEKHKKITEPPVGTYVIIREKQNAELQELSEKIREIKRTHPQSNAAAHSSESSANNYEQWQINRWKGQQSAAQTISRLQNANSKAPKEPFSLSYEKQIANHKKWQAGERQGYQLIVNNEKITNINLKGLRLQNSKFIGCTFETLDLSNTSFRKCDLTNSCFISCRLTQTDFTGAKLKNVEFKKCNKDEAIF